MMALFYQYMCKVLTASGILACSSSALACVSAPLTASDIRSRVDKSLATGAVLIKAKVTNLVFVENFGTRAILSTKDLPENVRSSQSTYEVVSNTDCSLSIDPEMIGRDRYYLLSRGSYAFFGREVWYGHSGWLSDEYQSVLSAKLAALISDRRAAERRMSH